MEKVIIIYNSPEEKGNAAEEETVIGANKISETLILMHYHSEIQEINKNNISKDLDLINKSDLVFNYCEWTGKNVEYEYQLLEIMENGGLVFTGCGLKEHKIAMDKIEIKDFLKKNGYPVLEAQVFEDIVKSDNKIKLKYPVIVKPSLEHCSIGLGEDSITDNDQDTYKKISELYLKYNQKIVVEEFAEGNEYQVFVFKTDKGFETLPVYETKYKNINKPILITYEDNWVNTSIDHKVERIGILEDKEKDKRIRKMSEAIFTTLGGKGYIRIDMREKDGKIYVLEVNPNPSIAWTEEYDFIKICAEGAGKKFEDILNWIISGSLTI